MLLRKRRKRAKLEQQTKRLRARCKPKWRRRPRVWSLNGARSRK